MPRNSNLSSMSIDALLALRDKISDILKTKASTLRDDLARLTGNVGNGKGRVAKTRGPRKGTKVAPKYRGPNGELWSGRGLKPLWLTAELKKGKKLESFSIK